MTDIPNVRPGDWIAIGQDRSTRAVVCHVYGKPALADIEVVYLDERHRAINVDVDWRNDHWQFNRRGDLGGYADRYTRLQPYVRILRAGLARSP